jgi:hypothetical protein
VQEATHACHQCQLRETFGAVSVGYKHCGAICWAKRYERGEVHDVVDAAKGFGECGFVFESTLGPFVRDALEVGKMLPRTN